MSRSIWYGECRRPWARAAGVDTRTWRPRSRPPVAKMPTLPLAGRPGGGTLAVVVVADICRQSVGPLRQGGRFGVEIGGPGFDQQFVRQLESGLMHRAPQGTSARRAAHIPPNGAFPTPPEHRPAGPEDHRVRAGSLTTKQDSSCTMSSEELLSPVRMERLPTGPPPRGRCREDR